MDPIQLSFCRPLRLCNLRTNVVERRRWFVFWIMSRTHSRGAENAGVDNAGVENTEAITHGKPSEQKTLRYQECMIKRSGDTLHISGILSQFCKITLCYVPIENFPAVYSFSHVYVFLSLHAFLWIASLCWKLLENK